MPREVLAPGQAQSFLSADKQPRHNQFQTSRLRYAEAVVLTVDDPQGAGIPIPILRPDKGGDWRMINVVLNNINLGKQYRTEFSSKLKDFNGDIDAVIDYWSDAENDPEDELAERGTD